MHKFYLSFNVDKFHLKPKTKKDLDISQKIPTFIKISKNTGTTPLYRCINKSR
jgi:hypothetical protein